MAVKRKWKYGFTCVTLGLFFISLSGHWVAGWFAYKQEQAEHNQPVQAGQYTVEMVRDTLENWQSEFLQLVWQVMGLALLWHIGSPQSKEGDDRKEGYLTAILRAVDKDNAEKTIERLEKRYPPK